jgi:hypothetical protein
MGQDAGRWTRGGVAVAAAATLLVSLVGAASPVAAVAPSGSPTLVAPTDSSDVAGNPVLTWTPVTGAAKYRVQVSQSASFSPIAYSVDTLNTSATPAAELANGNFYWRVAATDGSSGVGPYSPLGTFTKVSGSAPVVLEPSNGRVFEYPSETPVLQWEPLPGAKSYKVEIDDEDAFIGATTITTPNTAVSVISTLVYDKTYYWRVSATTNANLPTAASDARIFSVTWPVTVGRPVLTSPADTTASSIDDVVLTWSPVDGAKNYLLDVSPNPDFTNNLIEDKTVVRGTQYSPTDSYPNGAYYWRVRPVDTLDRQGPWSLTRTFQRGSPTPSTPTLLSPTQGATTGEWRFDWTSVPHAAAYEIQYDTTGSFVSSVRGCTTYQSSFSAFARPSQVSPQPTYPRQPDRAGQHRLRPAPEHRHVLLARACRRPPAERDLGHRGHLRALVGHGPVQLQRSGGQSRHPGAAALRGYLSPSDCEAPGCQDVVPSTPEFRWDPVPGAQTYLVRIAADRAFTNEVQRYVVAGTSLTPRESLPDNATDKSYYWFVQPCTGALATSPTGCVAVDQATLEANAHAFRKLANPVTLASPASGGSVTDVVAFTWDDPWLTQPEATGARNYRVQVATDAAFTNVIDTATVDQKQFMAVGKTYPDGTYYWRVQAQDGSGLGLSWSATRSFSKVSSVPSGLSASRLDAASALPVLEWDSLAYVSGYLVQVYAGNNENFPAGSLKKEVTVKLPTYAVDVALPAGAYSWRVRRLDPSGNPGPWQTQPLVEGKLDTFTVASPAPTLESPANGAQIKGNSILFSWSPVKGAAQYRLESSLSSNVTGSTIESVATVMTAWAPSSAYPDSVPVYWRVRALDGSGNTLSTSSIRSFLKDAKAPTATITTTGATSTLRPKATVSFAEPVSNVTTSTLTLRRATGNVQVSATLACTNGSGAATSCAGPSVRTAVVTAASNVVPGETYTVAVTSAVRDALGNSAVPVSAKFRALPVGAAERGKRRLHLRVDDRDLRDRVRRLLRAHRHQGRCRELDVRRELGQGRLPDPAERGQGEDLRRRRPQGHGRPVRHLDGQEDVVAGRPERRPHREGRLRRNEVDGVEGDPGHGRRLHDLVRTAD